MCYVKNSRKHIFNFSDDEVAYSKSRSSTITFSISIWKSFKMTIFLYLNRLTGLMDDAGDGGRGQQGFSHQCLAVLLLHENREGSRFPGPVSPAVLS